MSKKIKEFGIDIYFKGIKKGANAPCGNLETLSSQPINIIS